MSSAQGLAEAAEQHSYIEVGRNIQPVLTGAAGAITVWLWHTLKFLWAGEKTYQKDRIAFIRTASKMLKFYIELEEIEWRFVKIKKALKPENLLVA